MENEIREMRCGNCKWWMKVGELGLGGCRRFPPVFVHRDKIPGKADWEFPITNNVQFCGEFTPRFQPAVPGSPGDDIPAMEVVVGRLQSEVFLQNKAIDKAKQEQASNLAAIATQLAAFRRSLEVEKKTKPKRSAKKKRKRK